MGIFGQGTKLGIVKQHFIGLCLDGESYLQEVFLVLDLIVALGADNERIVFTHEVLFEQLGVCLVFRLDETVVKGVQETCQEIHRIVLLVAFELS